MKPTYICRLAGYPLFWTDADLTVWKPFCNDPRVLSAFPKLPPPYRIPFSGWTF